MVMTGALPTMTDALRALDIAIAAPRPGSNVGLWRWSVRQRLAAVREALLVIDNGQEWHAMSDVGALRDRGTLLSRLATLANDVLDRTDLEDLRLELRRLLLDVHRHLKDLCEPDRSKRA